MPYGTLLFFPNIFHDITQIAIQNIAQLVKGVGIDIFIFAKSIQLPGAESMIMNKLILGYSFPLHGLPQTCIHDHKHTPFGMCLAYNIPIILTIARVRAIIRYIRYKGGVLLKIITNFAIPHEVYLFYLKVANHLENCTPEDVMVDALTRYAATISQEILHNHNSGNNNTPQ